MRHRILVVGRDVALRARLARLLNDGGYRVELAESAAQARRIARRDIVLTIVVQEPVGPAIGPLLGAAIGKILVVAAPGTPHAPGSDLLDAADESGLLARVAEALRPVPEPEEAVPALLRFADYTLDPAGHSLADPAGNEVALTHGEFSLLQAFVQRPGRVMSRDQLLQALAGREAEAFDRSIDMLIVRLRRKIEPDPKRPRLIVTVPGSGYKFTAKVQKAEAKEAPLAEPAAAPPDPRSRPGEAPVPAERRQVTALCAELIAANGRNLPADPEELRTIIEAYRHRTAAIVVRHGGVAAQRVARQMFAYFGHPVAQEDAAERAIHAALALAEHPDGGEPDIPVGLSVRAGVATGLVVADPAGEVVGQAPSEAAGLSGVAAAGQVLVGATTRRLAGQLFTYQAVGPLTLRGFAGPVEAWCVVGPSALASRSEALYAEAVTPLVGREEELDLLLRRWRQAKSGETRVVLLTGEAGIGKSRTVRALQDRLAEEPHTLFRFFCSPHHQDSALHPVIAQLEHEAGWAREDSPDAKLAKLETLLAQAQAPDEDIALIATLLSLPAGDRHPLADMSPQRHMEKMLAALLALVERAAARRPVLMVFEDVHSIDPTSLELLVLAIERWRHLPLLLVMTARPEFTPPWPGYAHITTLALARLDANEVEALVERIADGRKLPAEVLKQIVARTDGTPLFAEELTKTVLESGLLRAEGDRYVLNGPLPPLAIPTTLHDSLMARLDRLASAREVAQVAAALGREFSYAGLRAVMTISQDRLHSALGDLVRSELVFCRGVPPEAAYTFKHALVQDAAYQSMLKSRRVQLHARIVDVLEPTFPELVQAEPETLARHFTAAALPERAIHFWLAAARRARRGGAHKEAIGHLNTGIALLPELPEPARTRLEVDLQAELGFALTAIKGYAAPEVEAAFLRADELCRTMSETAPAIPVLRGLTVFHWVRGNHLTARSFALQLVQSAERTADAELSSVAHGMLAGILHHMGDISASEAHIGELQAAYDPQQRRNIVVRFGEDTPSTTWSYHGYNQAWLGHLDRALAAAQDAVASARRTGHPYSVANALCRAAQCSVIMRDPVRASWFAEQGMATARELGYPLILATTAIVLGWASALDGKAEEGINQINEGMALWRSTGADTSLPLYFSLLSEAMLAQGEDRAAIAAAEEGWQWSARNAEHGWDCLVHCARGDALLASGEVAAAETDYQQALAWSRERSAKWGELCAGIRLARLWRSEGRSGQAHELLAPVSAWFTEGFDSPVLKEAKALLDELAPSHR